jgi:hypothetical protein
LHGRTPEAERGHGDEEHERRRCLQVRAL